MLHSISELNEQALNQIAHYKETVTKDPFRLNYHLMPPVGLLNDPNGFVYFKEQYHIFYQWNPFNTDHSSKFWGHYISDDLVHWKAAPIALAPDSWFDKNGCYSGSAIVEDGKMYLFYTGNVKDEAGNRESYQCMAVSEDGIYFEKKGPVAYRPKGYTGHFRDPKVFKEKDHWYMIIGAQTVKKQGEVVLFSSIDLENWSFLGPLAGNERNGLHDFGYMWECPDLFNLDGKDILIVSPQGLAANGYEYNNVFQSGYFTGKVDFNHRTFAHDRFTELDRGFDFYAPQTMIDEQGRRILFAWMGNAEEEGVKHPTEKYHWIHALTLPRQLEWKSNRLYQRPVKELAKLRRDPHLYEDVELNHTETELKHVNGQVFELDVMLKESNYQEFSIKIGAHTLISYHKESRTFTFQRKSLLDNKSETRHCYVDDLNRVHVFKDTSSIEIFINDGEEVFSSRVFDETTNDRIIFRSNGLLKMNVSKWALKKVCN